MNTSIRNLNTIRAFFDAFADLLGDKAYDSRIYGGFLYKPLDYHERLLRVSRN